MTAPTKEMLIEEIIENARRDRKRLEAVADGIVEQFSKVPGPGEDDQQFDPEIAAAFAEEIAKVGESLTKINHELIEVVKLDKGSPVDEKAPTKLDADEIEDALEAISPEERPN